MRSRGEPQAGALAGGALRRPGGQPLQSKTGRICETGPLKTFECAFETDLEEFGRAFGEFAAFALEKGDVCTDRFRAEALRHDRQTVAR